MLTATGAQTPSTVVRNDVVFTEYTPLSTLGELVRRLYGPERAGQTLPGQALDLTKERYSLYVPDRARSAPASYSLLVFIPPYPRAEVPRQWIPVLNRYDTIFVTAANSGNEAPTVRREATAVLAAHNVMKQYNVDPQRVYVGGFSGGARIALRLALGYPDLFRGVLLNAGSDPIGTADVPLPPEDIFKRFQESTRLVYVTGERDEENLVADMNSRRSLDKWCVFDVVTQTEPRTGHQLADAFSLGRALDALLGPRQPASDKLEVCRDRLAKHHPM